jgi:hypothetical protein
MTRSDLLHLLGTVLICAVVLGIAMLVAGRCR